MEGVILQTIKTKYMAGTGGKKQWRYHSFAKWVEDDKEHSMYTNFTVNGIEIRVDNLPMAVVTPDKVEQAFHGLQLNFRKGEIDNLKLGREITVKIKNNKYILV